MDRRRCGHGESAKSIGRNTAGRVLVWVDADVVQLQRIDAAFLSHASKFDVSYLRLRLASGCPSCIRSRNFDGSPRRPGTHPTEIPSDPAWRVDTGILTLQVNERTKALLLLLPSL